MSERTRTSFTALVAVLAIVMIVALAGCSSNEQPTTTNTTLQTTQTMESDAFLAFLDEAVDKDGNSTVYQQIEGGKLLPAVTMTRAELEDELKVEHEFWRYGTVNFYKAKTVWAVDENSEQLVIAEFEGVYQVGSPTIDGAGADQMIVADNGTVWFMAVEELEYEELILESKALLTSKLGVDLDARVEPLVEKNAKNDSETTLRWVDLSLVGPNGIENFMTHFMDDQNWQPMVTVEIYGKSAWVKNKHEWETWGDRSTASISESAEVITYWYPEHPSLKDEDRLMMGIVRGTGTVLFPAHTKAMQNFFANPPAPGPGRTDPVKPSPGNDPPPVDPSKNPDPVPDPKPGDDNGSKTIKATGITISPAAKEIRVNDYFLPTATVTPSNASGKVIWSSSNSAVAKVDTTGQITGLKAGKVTITAKIDNVTDTCEVEVVDRESLVIIAPVLNDRALDESSEWGIYPGETYKEGFVVVATLTNGKTEVVEDAEFFVYENIGLKINKNGILSAAASAKPGLKNIAVYAKAKNGADKVLQTNFSLGEILHPTKDVRIWVRDAESYETISDETKVVTTGGTVSYALKSDGPYKIVYGTWADKEVSPSGNYKITSPKINENGTFYVYVVRKDSPSQDGDEDLIPSDLDPDTYEPSDEYPDPVDPVDYDGDPDPGEGDDWDDTAPTEEAPEVLPSQPPDDFNEGTDKNPI